MASGSRPRRLGVGPSSRGLAACLAAAVAMVTAEDAAYYAAHKTTGAELVAPSRLPLHTNGAHIVDSYGQRVKWSCINWYGAYSPGQWVVGGLERQSMVSIVTRIVEMGFNCIRLPYGTESYHKNPAINESFVLPHNPQFVGKRMLDVFDAAVEELTSAGLMVIVNNHVSKDGWCCIFSQNEGLWYAPGSGYNASQWISSLLGMAQRYRDNPLVVAYDIRNEPHDVGDIHLSWGDGNPKTDLAAAMTHAGNAVLGVNPNVLIVIEGLCFASDLRPVREHPIHLNIPHRVVYEVHNYLEFQDHTLFSMQVMSFYGLKEYGGYVCLVCGLIMIALLLCWRALGMPYPPKGVLPVTWGTLLAVAGAIGSCALCLVMHVFRRMKACSYGVDRDYGPFLQASLAALTLGIALLLWGVWRMWPRCRWRPEDDWSGAEEEETEEEEDEKENALLARRRGVSRGVGGHCCSVPGWRSCSVLRRKAVRCLSDYAEQDAPTGTRSLSTPHLDEDDSDEENVGRLEWDRGMCTMLVVFVLTLSVFCVSLEVISVAKFERSYWAMQRKLDKQWGFVMDEGHDYTAPVWMGEFGEGIRGNYWLNLLRYFAERDVNWGYWPLNGRAFKDTERVIEHDDPVGMVTGQLTAYFRPLPEKQWVDETYGLLNEDYKTVRRSWQLLDLQGLMDSPGKWLPRFYPCERDVLGSRCGG